MQIFELANLVEVTSFSKSAFLPKTSRNLYESELSRLALRRLWISAVFKIESDFRSEIEFGA